MLRAKRGELSAQFSTAQADALTRWLATAEADAAEHFIITQSLAQAVATGYQVLVMDSPIVNVGNRWDPIARCLQLPVGSVWDLKLYVTSDTATASAQRNELFLADAFGVVGLGARIIDFGYQDRPAGLASPAFGNSRLWAPQVVQALRPIVRFNGSVAVNTIPGQGFTTLSGTRIA